MALKHLMQPTQLLSLIFWQETIAMRAMLHSPFRQVLAVNNPSGAKDPRAF
jgi:hypothetical protein